MADSLSSSTQGLYHSEEKVPPNSNVTQGWRHDSGLAWTPTFCTGSPLAIIARRSHTDLHLNLAGFLIGLVRFLQLPTSGSLPTKGPPCPLSQGRWQSAGHGPWLSWRDVKARVIFWLFFWQHNIRLTEFPKFWVLNQFSLSFHEKSLTFWKMVEFLKKLLSYWKFI